MMYPDSSTGAIERKARKTMASTQMSREEARSLYDKTLREMYPDDERLLARVDEVEREDSVQCAQQGRNRF